MQRRAYTALIVVLVLLILALLAAIGYIGGLLLTTQEKAEPALPIAVRTEEPRLLTSKDFEPDRSVLFRFPTGTLRDAQDNVVQLDALRGRTTVLIFWSSWCADCKEYLNGDFKAAVQSARSRGAAVHLVCRAHVQHESRAAAEAALQQLGLTEVTFMDPEAALYQALGLRWVPSAAIFDAQGRLMYTTDHGPDAAEMTALIEYAESPSKQTQKLLQTKLMTPAGLVYSGYSVKDGEVIPGNTLLSESQGLLMLWAAYTGDQAFFDQVWRAVRDSMSVRNLAVWSIESGKKSEVNASLDDLRIIEALALAEERWGLYRYDAAERATALYDRCVAKGLMRDYATLKKDTVADTVTVCYMDVAAMQAAAAFDPRWSETAEKSRSLLADRASLISDALPLYHTRYDVKKQRFTGDTVQMNEACVAVLNAVRAGVAFPETLDWLEASLEAGVVYARYGADGKVLPGYEFESTATYALLVQIGVAAGRERMTQLALECMERRRSFDAAMAGGYGEANANVHYAFDELEAMLAWVALETNQ